MIPPMGTINTVYWEWWLHHNPFTPYYGEGGRSSCKICSSDTSHRTGCPYSEIQIKFAEIKKLMDDYRNRDR